LSNENYVSQKKKAKNDRENVKERIVSGQEDKYLEHSDGAGREMTYPTRRENQKWNYELHKQQRSDRHAMKPGRKVKNVPRQRRGQRLGFVVDRQGGEAAPRGIAPAQPKECWDVPISCCSEVYLGSPEKLGSGQNTAGTNQARCLYSERGEGNQVNRAEHS